MCRVELDRRCLAKLLYLIWLMMLLRISHNDVQYCRYSVRLVGANNDVLHTLIKTSFIQGRLEVFYNGTWGTVCRDRFTDVSAKVVCSQLGLGFGYVAYAYN